GGPAGDRELDRGGATPPRPGPVRGRRRHRHVRPVAARAPRANLHASRRGRRPEPSRDPADQLRLQVRRPARGRPRLRRPVHAEPLLHRGAATALRAHGIGPRVRPEPARRPGVPALPPRVPRLRPAGVRERRQDASDDRARVHRWLSPFDRPRRGARDVAAGAGLRPGRRLPSGAGPGMSSDMDGGRGRAAMNLRRWLTPGIGVKRWLLLTFVGLLLLALGVAHVIRQATRDLQPGGLTQVILDTVTLQFLPYPVRGLLVGVLGLLLVGYGAYRLIQALTAPFTPVEGGRLVELIYQKKSLARGPRIVAIGGGTGLSALLRRLKGNTSTLTAVVAVADDGGSSGVLREELGIPPVGDIRRCLAALAAAERLMGELLEHRFAGSPADTAPEAGGPLGGHPVGNLLLA